MTDDETQRLARIEALIGRFHSASDSTESPDATTSRQHEAIVQLLALGVPAEDVADRLHLSQSVIEGLVKAEDPTE